MQQPDDREERIRARAYALWLEEGRPEGKESAHWREATRLIDEEEGIGHEGTAPHHLASDPASAFSEVAAPKSRRRKKTSIE